MPSHCLNNGHQNKKKNVFHIFGTKLIVYSKLLTVVGLLFVLCISISVDHTVVVQRNSVCFLHIYNLKLVGWVGGLIRENGNKAYACFNVSHVIFKLSFCQNVFSQNANSVITDGKRILSMATPRSLLITEYMDL